MTELGENLLKQLIDEKKIKPFSGEKIVASGRGSFGYVSSDPKINKTLAVEMEDLHGLKVGPKTEQEFQDWYSRRKAGQEAELRYGFSSNEEKERFLSNRKKEILKEMEKQGMTYSIFLDWVSSLRGNSGRA